MRSSTPYSLCGWQFDDEFNCNPFQKREYSRWEVFQEEKTYLPAISYEIASWLYGRTVNLNLYVIHAKNHYSCPYQYVKQKADLKITDTKSKSMSMANA